MASLRLSSTIHLRHPDYSASSSRPDRAYIIYHVSGNPGLIEYYRTFLTHLYGLLAPQLPSTELQVFGRDLSGFEVNGQPKALGNSTSNPPYGLQAQIQHAEQALTELVARAKAEGARDVRVILMGHSVGAYIVLELVRRLRESAARNAPQSSVRIVGAVCLTPTVTHIAKSSSGVRASWLLEKKHFSLLASMLAKAITLFIPTAMLALLIRAVMRFPADSARITAEFVKSNTGVRQALYMAGDEMREITHDAWDDEIWGAAHASDHPHPRPTLRFLFAKSDHWVADETRDELIKARAATKYAESERYWRPVMEVEEQGMPHAFCIKHSISVAERVCGYMKDIVEIDMTRE